VKDFTIDILVIEEDREAHITKHAITIDEVLEVLTSDYLYIAGREARWLLIGKTGDQRFLTIVVGQRPQKATVGLVTARPSRKSERSFYAEFVTQRGGEDDEHTTR
jgi:uncharacterized DUF497 family protein